MIRSLEQESLCTKTQYLMELQKTDTSTWQRGFIMNHQKYLQPRENVMGKMHPTMALWPYQQHRWIQQKQEQIIGQNEDWKQVDWRVLNSSVFHHSSRQAYVDIKISGSQLLRGTKLGVWAYMKALVLYSSLLSNNLTEPFLKLRPNSPLFGHSSSNSLPTITTGRTLWFDLEEVKGKRSTSKSMLTLCHLIQNGLGPFPLSWCLRIQMLIDSSNKEDSHKQRKPWSSISTKCILLCSGSSLQYWSCGPGWGITENLSAFVSNFKIDSAQRGGNLVLGRGDGELCLAIAYRFPTIQ